MLTKITTEEFKKLLKNKENEDFAKFIKTALKSTAKRDKVGDAFELANEILEALKKHFGEEAKFLKGVYISALVLLLLPEYEEYKAFVKQLKH
ncbi:MULTISPECIES: hypothetical protein [Thermoanaerobacter]|jgi:hemerythrin|uniref:Uncharacterized protein n=2 Tax=Thermoanaerobacter TaxID=1754 RepID=B0KAU2_THEP3|nr:MULTISPECIES: hypothetical protein [Thermoanaerobacter]ABY93713.1 hypothetical protein Teth39_0040 [Thermoanaerobacter pseudethanolicus ATCC 33223]ADV78674.1 hypothetical protein Thebr_0042 [Thermoanaerobacter brockii subsp. finnii Ako-1]HBW60403.1 hypothetical protein [Thermoanaerobacter sp.]